MKILLLIPLLTLCIIPVFADQEECTFTAYIEKSWVNFGDRPWVSGFVDNCDDKIQYHLKDFVHWQIKDINGDIVTENWHFAKNSATNEAKLRDTQPSKYKGIDDVFRGYGIKGANADTTEAKTYYLRENQYFFYLPQIHSIEFEHSGIYQIELTYSDYTRTVWFAVLDPDKYWQDS